MEQATILSDVFDPAALAPGRYIVSSAAPAYGLARALVYEKVVRFVGERYVDPRTKAVVFEVAGRKPNPANIDPSELTNVIPYEAGYFTAEVRRYADWSEKYWREAIQNAVDAGAKDVQCRAVEQPDGTWLVSCEDDGTGMDEETLRTKFLRFGGTTKAGGGGVGGFGKAKELLLLPWLSWEVHTRDLRAYGVANTYALAAAPERKGTKLTVRMPADLYTYGAIAQAYLEKCHLPGRRFTVDDVRVPTSLVGKDLLQEIGAKAAIYFTPSKTARTRSIFVRAHGLYMFDEWLGEDIAGHVLVELLAPTVQLLTDNRDGFRDSELRYEVRDFVRALTKDTKSALAKTAKYRKPFRGTGRFATARTERRAQRTADAMAALGATTTAPAEAARRIAEVLDHARRDVEELDEAEDVDELQERPERRPRPPREGARAPLGELPALDAGVPTFLPSDATLRTLFELVRGPTAVETAVKQIVWEPDYYVWSDLEGYEPPAEFLPATMSPRIAKLVSTWTELCRLVLIQLGSTVTFGVGVLFSDTFGAQCHTEDGENWLLVNPYRDYTGRRPKKLVRPTAERDLQLLYAAAIHEATHVADRVQYHDESFAAALTHNMAKCARGWRKIRHIERAARLGVGKRADVR